MNLTPDEMKLVEQMQHVFELAGCRDLSRNLAAMLNPTPDEVKPCPFCGQTPTQFVDGLVEHTPSPGCPLSLIAFPLEKWNHRTP